jgi:hypothetical protein
MERIGRIASKMSRDSILLYNVCVIFLSGLFSLFVFVVAGGTLLLSMIIIFYVGKEILGLDVFPEEKSILVLCFMSLAAVTGVFNLLAILKNIKIPFFSSRQSKK